MPRSLHIQTVQKQEPATTNAAHRSLDQPADKGANRTPKTALPHTNFMTPGVVKSLTRSAG